jgi:hypothetical protein
VGGCASTEFHFTEPCSLHPSLKGWIVKHFYILLVIIDIAVSFAGLIYCADIHHRGVEVMLK